MKSLRVLLGLLMVFLSFGCASAPTGPSEPGRPWISEVTCPRDVPAGDKAKVIFRYQGDETPVYAEVTLSVLTGLVTGAGSSGDFTAPVNYRFENQYEIPLEFSKNPNTWTVNFYVVDRKGRFSNELDCSITIR